MDQFERIAYDAGTGEFRWTVSGRGIQRGALAGSVTSHGYAVVKVARTQYRAHRLAWFLTHGEWPQGEIDHIDGDRLNNRLSNLRVVDRAGNSQNRRNAQRNSSHGMLGATWNKRHKRWQSALVANKVRHHLGYFDTPEEAHAAYMAAKAVLHIGGCRH